jgi:hypothetical protein
MQANREKVIAYASRGLSKSEKNYCVTERELLAVVYFIQYFRQYLLGRKFIVRTDHQALVWLFSLREPNGKIARWIEILAAFHFAIEYRPGKKQPHCDALSRCESPRDCSCPEVDTSEPLKCGPCSKCKRRAENMLAVHSENNGGGTPPCQVQGVENQAEGTIRVNKVSNQDQGESRRTWLEICSLEQLRKLQEEDHDVSVIVRAKVTQQKPSSEDMAEESPAARSYWVLWESLTLIDGVLCRLFQKENGTGEYIQLIVPRSLKKQILRQMHNSCLAGHLGVKKTKLRILRNYYWFNLKEDVKLHVQTCDICAADNAPNNLPRAPMGHLKAGGPWDTLAIDYLGPLPVTSEGNKYILVMTDHFTKYVEVLAVPTQEAEDCALRIANHFIARWGAPLSIHSDQGTTFESKTFQELCKLFEIRKTRTSPRNPKGNGQTERFNRTLIKMIKAFLVDQEEWDRYLGCLAGAYRATPNESTKLTPNLLSIGREIRMPADVVYGFTRDRNASLINPSKHVINIKEKMYEAHEVARKYLKACAQRSKERYDTKAVLIEYKVGDPVWLLREGRQVGVSPKLQRKFDGPYRIKAKTSAVTYIVQLNPQGDVRMAHHDKLKPYQGDQVPKWITRVKSVPRSLKKKSSCSHK